MASLMLIHTLIQTLIQLKHFSHVTTLGVSGTGKLKENNRFYGFTDFRGMPARRGRGTRCHNSEPSTCQPASTKSLRAGIHEVTAQSA